MVIAPLKNMSANKQKRKKNPFKSLLEKRNPLWITKHMQMTYGSGHASAARSGGCEADNIRTRVWSKM